MYVKLITLVWVRAALFVGECNFPCDGQTEEQRRRLTAIAAQPKIVAAPPSKLLIGRMLLCLAMDTTTTCACVCVCIFMYVSHCLYVCLRVSVSVRLGMCGCLSVLRWLSGCVYVAMHAAAYVCRLGLLGYVWLGVCVCLAGCMCVCVCVFGWVCPLTFVWHRSWSLRVGRHS